ncbi:MAG: response regulator [Candidatus Omnitrophota bacterium]
MEKTRVLIIDDEKDFVRMVQLNLEKTGVYKVRTAIMASKAMPIVRKFKPDVILLDVVMPGMSGGEFAHLLSLDENSKNIPIIFLTAIIGQENMPSHEEVIGKHYFLAKPVTQDKLIECIEKNIKA